MKYKQDRVLTTAQYEPPEPTKLLLPSSPELELELLNDDIWCSRLPFSSPFASPFASPLPSIASLEVLAPGTGISASRYRFPSQTPPTP